MTTHQPDVVLKQPDVVVKQPDVVVKQPDPVTIDERLNPYSIRGRDNPVLVPNRDRRLSQLEKQQQALLDTRLRERDVADIAMHFAERTARRVATEAITATATKPKARDTAPPVADAPGYELKPDPLAAGSWAELMTLLREYRLWAGEPSYREMAKRADQRVGHTTLATMLARNTMPRYEHVMAVISGCDGSQDDRARWATAWRLLRLGHVKGVAASDVRTALRMMPTAESAAG